MSIRGRSPEELERENEELRAQLEEARETLRAIREGDVDALVVSTSEGDRIFTLQGADQAYRTVIEQMQETAVTLIQNGGIRYANCYLAEMLRVPLEQIIGTPLREHVAEGDRSRLDELLREADRAGTARGEVVLRKRQDEAWTPAHLAMSRVVVDSVPSICAVVIDLTERKRAEQLAASEQHYRLLFDRNPDGVFAVDGSGRFTAANPACELISGYPLAELLRMSFLELCPPDQLERAAERFERYLARQTYGQLETALIRKDGRRIELLVSAEPVVREGRVVAVHCTAKDITDRKHAEEQLQQAKAAAEAANAAKDQFLATLSHELRTPLTPVLMLSQQLEAEVDLPLGLREDMKTIRQNIQLEARLIDDLLDLTRIARGKIQLKPEPVDVHELLQHAMRTCCDEQFAKRRLKVEWQLLARSSVVSADPARLEQVFWNLINNAIKFTPPEGTITIRTANVDSDRVCIEVTDTGKGIEADALQAIFSPFEQGGTETTRRYGGLGLGLAIARAVMEMHGGTITAQSDGVGRGAVFTVTLATVALQATAAPVPGVSPAAPDDERNARQPRILLVEDHQATALVLGRMARRWGWDVAMASSVRSALDLAAKHTFDMVISDLGLPDGSGHDLMRQLRDAYGIKGIALSGYGMEHDIQRSFASGFVVHLVKPLNFEELRHAVMAFMAGAALERR